MTGHDIEIAWLGNTARFDQGSSPVVIGRSAASSVVIPDGIVSRRHLILTWDNGNWNAEDVSTHGTFDPIGVKLSRTWVVDADGAVRLGSADGTEIAFRTIPANAPPPVDPALSGPSTVIDYSPPPRPQRNGLAMLAIPDQSVGDDNHQPAPAGRQNSVAEPSLRAPESLPGFETPRQPDPAAPAGVPAAEVGSADPASPGLSAGPLAQTPAASPGVVGGGEGAGALLEQGQAPSEPSIDLRRPEAALDLVDHRPGVADGWSSDHAGSDPSKADGVAAGPAETFVESSTLRIHVDGEDYLFLPGVEVTVGRDPGCTVVVDEHHTLVSRKHLRISYRGGHWWFEDISSKGSFVDGRALTGQYKAEGAFVVELGDRIGGTPLRVVTAGEHKAPRNVAALAVAAIAGVALLLVTFLAWLQFQGGADEAAALDDAKRSTVMLLAGNGRGSGFFVSDSLILTNQHVADLADQLVVAVSEEVDEPAEIRYIARPVESHPFLDLAVLEVTNTAQVTGDGTVAFGEEVDSVDVPILELGSSDEVTLGDDILSTGFPGQLAVSSTDDQGQLRLSPVSTSRGEAASFAIWPGCSNPDFESFIPADAPDSVTCAPEGDLERGVLMASFASGEGASGSPVVHNGNVVAVVFAGDSSKPNVSRSIASDTFTGWLDGVLAGR